MTARKPIVIDDNGNITELQAGDTLAGIASSAVESRYETYSGESVEVTAGRIMFQFGGLLNGGGVLNGGRIIEAKQS